MNAKLADFSELSKFLSLKVQVGFDLFSFLLWEGAEAEPQHTEKKAETSIYEGISLGLHYFAGAKIGGASEMNAKTSCFALHFSRLALLCGCEDRRCLGIKNKSRFILCFSRLALSLPFKNDKNHSNIEKNHPACICHLWHMDSHVWATCLQRFLL